MKYDGTIDVAVGLSAKTRSWKNRKYRWSELAARLTAPNHTTETLQEFLQASKEDQLRIKDVGGFVGGYLRNGKRAPGNVLHRQLITLDIDFGHPDFWDNFTMLYDNAAVLHGTHKNSPTNPRYRLVMPLSREVSPDEYVAISRRVAGDLGIELFDNSTFETNRLMFWPSTPKDIDYYAQMQDGPWLDADEVLGSYVDWTDSSEWPMAQTRFDEVRKDAAQQEDPETKRGLIGAFCRAYPIQEAIETLLPDVYVPAAVPDRYTYTKGSTSAGLIIYDGKFAYSHHGTDPCGGMLCNSYDLVRIHKFGYLDKDGDGKKTKSMQAMDDFVRNDPRVREMVAKDKLSASRYDFSEDLEDISQDPAKAPDGPKPVTEEDTAWMKELELDAKGGYVSSDSNLNIIFANDPRLKGQFRQNEFDSKGYVFGSLPWRKIEKPEPMRNVDYSGVRNYLGSIYGISAVQKIDDALALEMERNRFHPIRDYLKGLEWDGTPRVDTMLIDYLGAKDNVYTREASRKMLTGAVARVMEPGCKFDLVLMLVGPQGAGKSTLIKRLGQRWFSDTFLSVQGKEALEQIQGAWLIEMAELAGLRKAEVESVKHFISKQEDVFRPAYARASETFPRQCVFIGTTNDPEFLRDPSGNRRFMPVDIDHSRSTKDVFHMPQEDVDQIWAEAFSLYKSGERLWLGCEAEDMAREEQRAHSESDEREGIIISYLNRKLPPEWDTMDLWQRRDYLNDPLSPKGTEEREYVCVAEIWCECLGRNKEDMDRYKTREINDLLKGIDGWVSCKSTKNFPIYGKQKYYIRSLD